MITGLTNNDETFVDVEILFEDHAFDEISMPGTVSFTLQYIPLKDDAATMGNNDDDDEDDGKATKPPPILSLYTPAYTACEGNA
jgi:hypothetical protein